MKKLPEGLYYVEGLEVPETPEPRVPQDPWSETTVVGKPLPRVDGYERVSGTAVYPSDVSLPRMLYGAILRCKCANGVVTSVDVSAAERMPAVHAVISAFTPDDNATRPYSQLIKTNLFNPTCRCEGEAVAAVAAETPYQAHDALRAIQVEYDELPFVSDERHALDPGAHQVQDGGNRAGDPRVYERGDIARGFAEADVVLEETYRTECEIHTPLELHGCVAKWDGDSLTIWESTQGVYNVQAGVAEALRMPLSKVRVVGHYMGGGFGSKLQAGTYTLAAALLAKKTARPVKLIITREDSLLVVGNRPPANMRVKAGIKRDGTLTALELTALATGGYQGRGSGLVDFIARELYLCPNVRTELSDRYINAPPQRPFRGPGHPQGAWAVEQMLDALADAIDMDPVALRAKNVPTTSQTRGNRPYTSNGFEECLVEGARAFQWEETRAAIARGNRGHIKRGVGVAGGTWVAGGGGPPSIVVVKLFPDGSVNLNMGASDIGTGTKTVMAMVVAEELGVDPDAIQIEHADTGTTQFASASGGSKTIPTESPAVRAGALEIKEQILELAAAQLKVDASTLVLRDGTIVSTADSSIALRIPEIRALRRRGNLTGVGYRGPNPQDKVIAPFAAQFCEVEVNTLTGEVEIVRFLAAHDSGRIMNKLTCQNQVFGGVTMGIGYAMTERRILDGNETGKMVNKNWHDYKIPTAMDVPADMTFLPIEPEDTECNTVGAKGIGEPATIPTAAAVANAIAHATGVRVTDTPIDPTKLMQALAERREGE